MSRFQFGNVVVVDDDELGVIVKSWGGDTTSYGVYVRGYNCVREYEEEDIKHYIYSKQLTEDEYEYYKS